MFHRIAAKAKALRHNGHDTELPFWYVNHRGRMRGRHRGINVSTYRCLRRLACQRGPVKARSQFPRVKARVSRRTFLDILTFRRFEG